MAPKKSHSNTRLILGICIAVGGFFISLSHYIFNLVYSAQPTPFLDEVFHIPQAAKYFHGSFDEWDEKITTLPGLYLLSIGFLKPVSWLLGIDLCGVYAFRFTNLVACIGNCYLLFAIQTKLQQPKRDIPTLCLHLLSTINMASFPVSYFFSFLYYTDTVSVMLILLTYLLHLEKCNILAAATGLISVAVRQTNVIWVAFIAAQALSQALKEQFALYKRKLSPNAQRNLRYFLILWELLQLIWKRGWTSFSNFSNSILQHVWGYIVVCFAFLVFVLTNGSIVVGDKSAHEAALHLPQLLYFSLFTSVFCFPYFISGVVPCVKFILSHKKCVFGAFCGCLIIVASTSHVHPYLLADNRHYAFYVWKRLYERHFIVKYALFPIYFFGMFNIFRFLKQNDIIFQISYALCITLCLVPHKLLEFRYFIIPYLIFRLHISQNCWWQVVCEFFLFGFINIATIYMFLTKVFYWSDSNEPQRILW